MGGRAPAFMSDDLDTGADMQPFYLVAIWRLITPDVSTTLTEKSITFNLLDSKSHSKGRDKDLDFE